jgi:4'-phosphopantetheinyl transferase
MNSGSISVAVASVQELPAAVMSSLAQAEVERASEFKASHRRLQYLCARSLLRALLQHHTGAAASSHKLTSSDKGKPICLGGPAISIAHSGDLIVCAATDRGEIGVDIEMPRKRTNVDGIANRYFDADEASWLATQPEDRFYMLWVLKEAWLKAKGIGIAGGLSRLRCSVTPPKIDVNVSNDDLPSLSLYELDDAMIGIATLSNSHKELKLDRWDPPSSQFDHNSGFRFVASTDAA